MRVSPRRARCGTATRHVEVRRAAELASEHPSLEKVGTCVCASSEGAPSGDGEGAWCTALGWKTGRRRFEAAHGAGRRRQLTRWLSTVEVAQRSVHAVQRG